MKAFGTILDRIEENEIHETLNPKLWDNMELKPEVLEQLQEIAKEFINNLEIPLDVLDIELIGSNASYNYTDKSDIDLHIITNFEFNYVRPEILQELYNAKKGQFNDRYNISIEGIPVEVYIQDVNSMNATNGIYSIVNNEWIKQPKPVEVTAPDISSELSDIQIEIDTVINQQDAVQVKNLINQLYLKRKQGLATDGEYSKGNLIFKSLRNDGILDKLKETYYNLRSDELSLEGGFNEII